jgi:tRNA dimethylallyltransferase
MHPHREKQSIVVICGPTGIGKTAVAITLAQRFNGEIISADSMQVYRRMDIGTAKATPEEQAAAPHHMIDIVAPDEPFDAARFAVLARTAAAEIAGRGMLPIVAGGTGLYIKALTQGIFQAKATDARIRKRLQEALAQEGPAAMHRRLAKMDPEAARRIHPNDRVRILRALEVFEATGRPISDHHSTHRFGEAPFRTLKIGLEMARTALYDRINRRVEMMLDSGLLSEVLGLLEMGYDASLKSMKSIGYRHMADFIEGRLPWDEAVRTLKRDTRRYAKRQYTWFKADPGIRWAAPEALEEMGCWVEAFLKRP